MGQARTEEKVDGLAKRIDNQELISRGALVGLLVAVLGLSVRLFFLVFTNFMKTLYVASNPLNSGLN